MPPSVLRTPASPGPLRAGIAHFKSILAPPIFPADPDKTRQARTLNSLIWWAILVLLLITLGNFVGGKTPLLVIAIDLLAIMLSLGCYRLMRSGQVRLAGYIWMPILIVGISATAALLGTIRTPTTAMLIPVIIAAGLLISQRVMLLVTVLSSLSVALLIYAENAGWLPAPNLNVTVTQWVTYTAAFTVCAILVNFSVRETRHALDRAQVELAQRGEAEQALHVLTNELGTRVQERTGELSTANELLQSELAARRHREQELTLRLQVTRHLAGAPSLREISITILETIGRTLDWQVVEFHLFDEQNTRAVFSTYWWDRDPFLREFVEVSQQKTLSLSVGLAHKILSTHQPVWLTDASADSDVVRAPLLARAGLHAGAGFPIQISGTICGIFLLFSYSERPYEPAQVELLNQIGSEFSQFIIRTRSEQHLHDTRAELANQVSKLERAFVRMNAIYRISRDGVRDLRTEELLQRIADTLGQALQCDRVSVITMDIVKRNIEQFVKGGAGAENIVVVSFDELWDGLCGWSIRERRPALSPKGYPDLRESIPVQKRRIETRTGAVLVAPLIYQAEVLGTITAINRPDQRDFDSADAELIQVIANQAAVTVAHKRNQETLRYQNEFFSALNAVTVDLLNRKERTELLDAILRAATRLLNAPFGQIFLADGDELVVAAFTPNLSTKLGDRVSRSVGRLAWQAFDTRKPATVTDYATWEYRRRIHDAAQVHAAVDFPIYNEDNGLGVLALGRALEGSHFDAEQIRYGVMFAQLVALVLDNLELRESLHDQALRDPLTGLYNRRFMHDWLRGELQRAARHTHPVSLIMLDVDHFKQLNDSYGHRAGDFVLQQVGAHLITHLRGSDIACRYGGEEFLLILPQISPDIAFQRAEQLRQQIETQTFAFEDALLPPITTSIGIASFPNNAADPNTLISAADAALYQAKNNGRNRAVLART